MDGFSKKWPDFGIARAGAEISYNPNKKGAVFMAHSVGLPCSYSINC